MDTGFSTRGYSFFPAKYKEIEKKPFGNKLSLFWRIRLTGKAKTEYACRCEEWHHCRAGD